MHLAKNANPRSEVTCKTCELHIMTLGKGTFRMIPGRQRQCAAICWNYRLDHERERIIFDLSGGNGLRADFRVGGVLPAVVLPENSE